MVSSTRSGMGKSLYVKKKAASLKLAMSNDDFCVTIPIHGPVVTADTLMDYFKKYTGKDNCTIYHLDIAPRVSILEPRCCRDYIIPRYWPRWTVFCSHCSFWVGSVTAEGLCGGVMPVTSTWWRLPYPRELWVLYGWIPQCMHVLFYAAQSDQEGFQTLNLLKLLPTVCCSSPRDVALERQQQLGINTIIITSCK